MDQVQYIELISGQTRGLAASALRCALRVASWPYGAITGLRRKCYNWGVLPGKSAGVGVISIGNVTTGGTGKTPTVAWVARQLVQAGANPAVLMRGYKSVSGFSEEAELLRSSVDCEVVVDPDRVAGAAGAVLAGADVLIMDDGFQHRRLKRNLDIVLIDAVRPFGFGHWLPRGLLREPVSSLKDSDAVIVTHTDEIATDDLDRLCRRLAKLAPQASVHRAVHKPVSLLSQEGQEMPVESLAERNVLAFCGIGRPGSFFNMVRKLGANISEALVFDDHAEYTSEALGSIHDAAANGEVDAVVTTYKDSVKLGKLKLAKPFWTLMIEIEILGGGQELAEKAQKVWRSGTTRPDEPDVQSR